MTGIEVIGLVLGGFPLLIAALERSRKAAEVYDDWWQIKKEYRKCKQELQYAELALESNLEQLLLPMLVDDDEVKELISEPGGARWKNAELERKLVVQLPRSYSLFINTVNDINIVMKELKQELGIDKTHFMTSVEEREGSDSGQNKKSKRSFRAWMSQPKSKIISASRSKWTSKANIEFQTQRIKFGLGRANRNRLFDELTKYNARLRDLLDTNEKSSRLQRSRENLKKSLVTEILWCYWRYAKGLHTLVTGAFSCRCKESHFVQLRLHHQTQITKVEFRLRFLFASKLDPSRIPWTWREIDVLRKEQAELSEDISLTVPALSPTSSSPSIILNLTPGPPQQFPSLQSKIRPTVKWAKSESRHGKQPPAQATDSKSIKDLCTTMSICEPDTDCLGFLEDDDNLYSLNVITCWNTSDIFESVVTLEDLMSKKSPIRLDRRQRYSIALTLASSHLQLQSSAWLGPRWVKSDIVFHRDSKTPNKAILNYPYISRPCFSKPTEALSPFPITDRGLPTLGILLIELCYGMPLEEHEMRKQYTSTSGSHTSSPDLEAALDLAVALEWSRSVNGEAGEQYADAVDWCLRTRRMEGTDHKWREEFFRNVVVPLQFCHEQLSGKDMT